MEFADLIQSIDIVEFISQFVELEEKNGEYWGLSCFKEEKTPSFSVRKDPPVFYDYSSGIGGNLFNFVQAYYNCSKREAAEKLIQYAGVDGIELTKREKLAATLTCKKFAKPKNTRKPCIATVLPDDYMLRYEKVDSKLDVWRAEGIGDESLEKFQVYYDSFSNRLVYPVRNMDGKIVNIGGRTLDPDWKAKGQRKYNYFYKWGSINTIYGLAENMEHILKAKEVILFEGCKSVLLADTWGIHNCGAILTSHLSPAQLKILIELSCRVVFALDKDVNIREDHRIERLRNYVNVEYIYDFKNRLDEKDAPVDKGAEVFNELYKSRLPYRP